MKITYTLEIISWILLCLFPSVCQTLFSSSSLATGLSFALILFAIFYCFSTSNFFIGYSRTYFLLLLFISLQFLVLLYQSIFPTDPVRSLFSFCFLLLIGLVAPFVKKSLEKNRKNFFPTFINNIILIFFINSLLGLLKIDLFSIGSSKPVGFFSEPSIFAITLAPFLAYHMISKANWYKFYWVYFFIWSLLIQSLTTLIVCFFTIIFIISLRNLALFCMLTTFILVKFDYFISRINITSSSDNLSALVFLQGWQMAFNYFIQTNGIGVGLNNFGINYSGGEIQNKIFEQFSFEGINLLDGGSIGPKLIGEFGLVGLFLLGVFLYKAFYAFIRLRQISRSNLNVAPSIFFTCVIFTGFIELFFRGFGYFTPTFFMLIVALFFYKSNDLFSKLTDR